MIYRFDILGSSNDEAQRSLYTHGDAIVAQQQTAGRGQRGHTWLSSQGLNLTFSMVLCPQDLEVRKQFIISQIAALAICEVLQSYGLAPRIKWTNDIYIGDNKIAGILIENRLSGLELARSIVGIGLNVNQREFSSELPNPTSMALEMGQQFNPDQILEQIIETIIRLEALRMKDSHTITTAYHSLLYRLAEPHTYRLKSGELRRGSIIGVAPTGELSIAWSDGEQGSYLFSEVEFVIGSRKD